MIFTQFRFFAFFLIVFFIYWGLQKNSYRKIWLLICSYVFYGAWDWRFLSLIFVSTIIDYTVGIMLSKPINSHQRKAWLLVSLVANLGFLGFFKYYNFFIDSASDFLYFLGISASFKTLEVILPVGISFYTFQTLSYSIDIYFGKLKTTKSFLDLALYVSFFPQLVAGPIVRASTFLPQLLNKKYFSQVNVRNCLILFMVGFIKKACVSDNLAPIIDQYFSQPEIYTSMSAWFAVISYAIQIYCDFSGYSDMAIACAGLLGYELCLNFNFPYFANNITDFWRRWHISLSDWLKDYLYIPLGGNRGGKLFTYRNLMITMLLGGLWHGAAWTFIVWGGLQGALLIIHRQWTSLTKSLKLPKTNHLIGVFLTFYCICIGWIFFRSQNFHDALIVLKSFILFNNNGSENLVSKTAFIIFIPLIIAHWTAYKQWLGNFWSKIPRLAFAIVYGLIFTIILPFIPTIYSPFIYFQF